MRLLRKTISSISIALFLYLLFWPTSLEPEIWTTPPNPGYTGDFAANTLLQAVEVRHLSCPECEDIAIDSSGRVYGAAVDGRLLMYDSPKADPVELVNTGGRPLGLDFDQAGNLYIADARKGLLRYSTDGQLEELVNSYDGKPFGFTDDLEVGPDGKVYFSDASDRWAIESYKLDILEHLPVGKLYVYDPATKEVDLLLDKLYFANGIALAADTSFVLVNETSSYRTLRYYLKGEKTGTVDTFIQALPAFPDGISRGSDGIFWLAMISPRNPLIDDLSEWPFLRKVIARLPDWLQPAPATHAGVLGINSQGEVVYNIQDPDGKFSQISSVQEWNGHLFFGSLGREGIGYLESYK
ncbi:MAG: SMP-30/gluconolactonase/LRE family protein [Lewinella sp.]|uniref:SMP-30/gluconolactonase/LRE family protein n=1 Tax=Lewinella sp. TaxID=2004506 RepID=UPI003D6B32CA